MTLTTTPAEIVARAEAGTSPGVLGRHPSWRRVPVGSLVQIVNGAPFPSRQFNTSGVGLPLIRIRDVGVSAPITYYDGPAEAAMLVRHGDLLVGMDGDFRIARWTGPEALLNQRVCRLDVKSEALDERWLLHSLQGYLDAIWSETSSVTVKHLSSKSIAQIPLPLPEIDEQRRIVDVLEDHLSRIEHASRSLENAEQRAASLSASSASRLISAGAGRAWTEARFGGATVAIPAHWRVSTMGDEAVLVQYGSGAKTGAARDADDVPVLRMGNVKRGRVQLDSLKYLPRAHPDLERLLLDPGDLLFNRTNSAEHVGKSAVFKGASGTTSFASYLIRVRLNSDVDPNWANLVINSSFGRAFVSSVVSQQVGQANVNGTKLKAFPLPVPPRSEQERLVAQHEEAIEAGLRVAAFARDNLQRALALRRSLLDAAFSGRL